MDRGRREIRDVIVVNGLDAIAVRVSIPFLCMYSLILYLEVI